MQLHPCIYIHASSLYIHTRVQTDVCVCTYNIQHIRVHGDTRRHDDEYHDLGRLAHFNPLNSLKDSCTQVAIKQLMLLRRATGSPSTHHGANNIDKPRKLALHHLLFPTHQQSLHNNRTYKQINQKVGKENTYVRMYVCTYKQETATETETETERQRPRQGHMCT